MSRVEIPLLPGEDHHCPECGVSYPALTLDEARALIAAVPDRTRAAALAVPDPRRRASPSRWSALEYVCHLRDVYVSSTIRLYRVRTEDRPSLEPMLNDLRTVRFRHNEMVLSAVLDELRLTVAGFLDEVDRVRPDGWTRTATRLPGEERTARWLVRHAAHEGVHHIRDIEAVRSA